MHYDSVLMYVRKVLENRGIPSFLFREPFEDIESLDMGLRESLMEDFDKNKSFKKLTECCKEHTLYYFTDNYYCTYVCMWLPASDTAEFFIAGPFTYVEINKMNYYKLLSNLEVPAALLPILKTYYYNIAFVSSESQFNNLMETLAEIIWQGADQYTVAEIKGNIWNAPDDNHYLTSLPETIYLSPVNTISLEKRYEAENQLMQAVSQGNQELLNQALASFENRRLIPRLADSLRDYKNYMVIYNTILRKAAEQGYVHPVYLDEISSKYAKKIENLTTPQDTSLMKEMARKYCLLVRNYSVRGYSPVIQKVINQINLNLTSDLGLKNLSEMFHISANYLSSLFKKEMGITLTDYVNKRRVEQAVFYLNTTDMQIQTIASYCGIQDINYFTRILKKFIGMTPSKFREQISRHH